MAFPSSSARVFRFWYFDGSGSTSQGTGARNAKGNTLTWKVSLTGAGEATLHWKFPEGKTFQWDLVAVDGAGKKLLDMQGTAKK